MKCNHCKKRWLYQKNFRVFTETRKKKNLPYSTRHRWFGRKRCQKKRKDVDYKLVWQFFQHFVVHEWSAVKHFFNTYICYTPDRLFWLNLYLSSEVVNILNRYTVLFLIAAYFSDERGKPQSRIEASKIFLCPNGFYQMGFPKKLKGYTKGVFAAKAHGQGTWKLDWVTLYSTVI